MHEYWRGGGGCYAGRLGAWYGVSYYTGLDILWLANVRGPGAVWAVLCVALPYMHTYTVGQMAKLRGPSHKAKASCLREKTVISWNRNREAMKQCRQSQQLLSTAFLATYKIIGLKIYKLAI